MVNTIKSLAKIQEQRKYNITRVYMVIQVLQEMQNGRSSRLFRTKSILLFMQDRVIFQVIIQLCIHHITRYRAHKLLIVNVPKASVSGISDACCTFRLVNHSSNNMRTTHCYANNCAQLPL